MSCFSAPILFFCSQPRHPGSEEVSRLQILMKSRYRPAP
nr:hypothetical protein [Sicyoidochytrium minutum DNA virus]